VLVAIFTVAVAIFVAVVAQDLRQRQVSNFLCAGIAGLGIIRWAILMQIAPAAWALAAAILIFGIGVLFNWRGWLGGGDVKLISAITLLLGGDAEDILRFLFLLTLIGSGLAVILLFQLQIRKLRARRAAGAGDPDALGPPPGPPSDHDKVPYAVAVALAAAIVLFLQVQRA